MRKVILSGVIGNALEWYDYALYGHFTWLISLLFFPPGDPYTARLMTFGVFAVGFFMRPVGAILFGYLGDRYGRRFSLAAAILLMAIPTACIGFLPTYATIGIAAPIALTIIRLLQGISLGGEFSGSIAFMVEHAPQRRRGYVSSLVMMSMCLGILLGSLTAVGVSQLLSPEALRVWGWRVPFVVGLAIGGIGWYIRRHLPESPEYLASQATQGVVSNPLSTVLSEHRPSLWYAISIYLTVTVPFYTLVIFLNNFMSVHLHYAEKDSLLINSIAIFCCTILLPIFGHWSDRMNHHTMLLVGALAFVTCIHPIIQAITASGMIWPLLGQIWLAVLVAWFMAPVPAVLVSLFPARVRYTGVGISYNISAALFGGTVPMVFTWLLRRTESYQSIGFYIMFFAVVTASSMAHLLLQSRRPRVLVA